MLFGGGTSSIPSFQFFFSFSIITFVIKFVHLQSFCFTVYIPSVKLVFLFPCVSLSIRMVISSANLRFLKFSTLMFSQDFSSASIKIFLIVAVLLSVAYLSMIINFLYFKLANQNFERIKILLPISAH